MQVPKNVRQCVAFVGIRQDADTVRPIGTAFLLGKEIPGSSKAFFYLVTAKHVITVARNRGATEVYLRLNWTDGRARWEPLSIAGWHYHPSDPSVDVAVRPTGLADGVDHLVYPISRAATRSVILSDHIGVGDEIFIIGLFVNHFGEHRNIPIVRVGTIAAMPEERVRTALGLTDAYLIEARSIGGLSGSPVFANLGSVRHIAGQLKFGHGEPVFYLLGLMHGHWDVQVSEERLVDTEGTARINMGIGIVVPVEKIIETIEQEAVRALERPIEPQLDAQSAS